MKKIFATLLIIAVCFAFVGCSSNSSSIYNGSYWLKNSSNLGVYDVNETNVYAVSYSQSKTDSKLQIKVDNENSSYVTVLTKTTFGEAATECYLLETTLSIVGEIVNGEETIALNDSISTKCYFLGVDNSLKPLYSERNVKAHSIKLETSGSTESDNTYSVGFYDYALTSTYTSSSAQTSVVVNQKPESDATFVSFENKEYADVFSGTTLIDNELLMFAPRAMNLTSSTSKSFRTIDVVSKTIHKMTLTSVSSEPTKTISLSSYFRNGEKVLSALCYGVSIAINADAAGSAITAYYVETNNSSLRAVMIEANSSAPYSLGTYTYSIAETTAND
jgi:hypothetical protein